MEENNILDFSSALNALDKVSESFKVDVWVPSKQSNLTFRELDAKQQKDLLSAAMDTSVYNTSFIKAFYGILKNNVLSDDKTIVDTLTLIDKASVALSLKAKVTDKINIVFDENKNISNKFEISSILEKFKSYKNPKPTILESKSNEFLLKVEIIYPTIKVEYDYDHQFKGNKKQEDVKTTEDVQQLISNAFLGETSKYVNRVWVNEDEVDLSVLKFDQRIKLIEKLPSNLIQKIVDIISLWKQDFDAVLTVKQDEYSKVISIDSLLFLS
jgi:hypothetical protein